MKRKIIRTITLGSFALVVMLGAAWQAHAQDAKTPYPSMAPLDQYLIADPNAGDSSGTEARLRNPSHMMPK